MAQARLGSLEGCDRELRSGEAVREGNEMLASVARLWPVAVVPIGSAGSKDLVLVRADHADARVPVRDGKIVGPLDVYYFNYLTEALGAQAEKAALSKRSEGVLAQECFNLIDGRRSVSEIRDILTGRYAPVPLAEVSEYVELLAKAKAITWK